MSVFTRGRTVRRASDCAAIFVHAGAGYHSIQNEGIHLQACNDAASAGMRLLRNGASAVDAVEMAIKVLEDREITNAGYGSNLSIDGHVEGDAVVVDHFGRSGGCGAVSQIKNPISLARTILDTSTQELTLKRVPPNLLVGTGALEFARQNGLPICSHDDLISPAARERWTKWRYDLKVAEKKARRQRTSPRTPSEAPSGYDSGVYGLPYQDQDQDPGSELAIWNEGQPVSPPVSPSHDTPVPAISSRTSSADSQITAATPNTPVSDTEESPHPTVASLTRMNLARHGDSYESVSTSADTSSMRPTMSPVDRVRYREADHDPKVMSEADDPDRDESDDPEWQPNAELKWHDGASTSDESSSSSNTLQLPSITPSPPEIHEDVTSPAVDGLPLRNLSQQSIDESTNNGGGEADDIHGYPSNGPSISEVEEDMITDTVGAIAIDNDGNIACGASSGGIGMKFSGRLGPAALVGVGAAVNPMEAEDRCRTTTAVVTSGTGEHMATTLAAKVCAERLYNGMKKRRGGGFEHCEDDVAVRAMIEQEFMEHPSVKSSHSTGAIGILAVKKFSSGVYLYFAHNTDSFALASMHANEPKPTCTMSRSHGNGMLAQGGRAIRYSKKKW